MHHGVLLESTSLLRCRGTGMRSAGDPGPDRRQLPPPRYRLLRPDDEAEVEKLYQRLKTVGHLDQKKTTDEK